VDLFSNLYIVCTDHWLWKSNGRWINWSFPIIHVHSKRILWRGL